MGRKFLNFIESGTRSLSLSENKLLTREKVPFSLKFKHIFFSEIIDFHTIFKTSLL